MRTVIGFLLLVPSLAAAERPNIVFIMTDDQAPWAIGVSGNKQAVTPNMDKLFANSVQLNRHYVHLSGSASRSQFLTGRYAMNLGFGEFHSWKDSTIGGIPIGQPTIANWLSEFGDYTTYAVGKWNLGSFSVDILYPSDFYRDFTEI